MLCKSLDKTNIYLLGVVLLFSCSFSTVYCVFNDTPSLTKEAVNTDWDKQYGTLILTNVIYRHGDRTPVEPYPLDPYKNLSYWPVGWGQLTNRGKEQHFELGKWLRQRYANLLNSSYSKDEIYVRSTDVDRTLMSAESNLAGLYLPEPAQVWNPSIKWQPIPVHTVPEKMDELLAAKKPCPRYDVALRAAKKSKPMQIINQKYAELYQYLTVHTGENITDVTSVEYVYNTLYIESLYKLRLPAWTESVFPDKMATPAALSFTVAALTEEMRRLKSGPLLGEIVRHMKNKIDKKLTPDRKMFMYSGHDTTLANMLMTLGVFDVQSPPYAGIILFDLWQKGQDYFVTVMFRNSTGEPHLLEIPGCDQVCPLTRFLTVTEPMIPINWDKECIVASFEGADIGLGDYPAVLIGLILFGVVIITMSVCLVITFLHSRQKKSQFRYQRLPADASRGHLFQPI